MILAETRGQLEASLEDWSAAGERIALVPTMGNLHEGHLRLVGEAQALASRVVVSIFVNPLQFGPQEDFASYPRTLQADRELLQAQGADLLFAPPVEQVYPQGQQGHTQVEVPDISAQLCGASRPGHFSGVATVVCKLLNLVRPQLALFGEKDYQQLLVIRRMVADLALPVQIIGVPTVREADGLALSSRNRYLSTEQRQQAPRLYRTLCWLAEGLKAGAGDFALLEQEACARLSQAGFQPDYVSIRRSQDLAPAGPQDHSLRLLAAAQLGQARLIDNLGLVLTAES